MNAREFSLTADEMRASGHDAVELVVRFLESLRELPAFELASHEELSSLVGTISEHGRPISEVLQEASEKILRYRVRPSHPRFFAFVPGVGNYAGALADFLAHGQNVFTGSWMEASGPTMVEMQLIDWLRDVIGFPVEAGGVFVSGGSIANLTALAVARDTILGEDGLSRGVVYMSDQTHSSVERALRLIGFARRQIRKLASGDDFRIPVDHLRECIDRDRAEGLRPCCVVANAGTTNTGAVDPLRSLALLCRQSGMWLHVDGAYGAAAALCDEGRAALDGLDQADSVALDPHKWMFQPFACGCVLVRKGALLPRTFHMRPEYLEDVGGSGEINFWDYGPELTRPFRALKLWVSLQVFGVSGCRDAIEHGFHLSRVAEDALRAMPDWEIRTPAQMGIVTFRYAPAGMSEEQISDVNRETGLRFSHGGHGFVVSTALKGRTVLRMCTINPQSTEDDVRETLAMLNSIATQL
ncbi:MAG: aminotransferase class I/II-fold pyridoxal phosphate-dependent enzyme [Acidobacteria bacterium]|nr:aminotransferase class I/II-fold pyridoxal phosphate-dependent enzyme [Acidobacteriota bacterium]